LIQWRGRLIRRGRKGLGLVRYPHTGLVLAAALLAGAPAYAADRDPPARIETLERQLRDVQRQLAEIRAASPDSGALTRLRTEMDESHARLSGRLAAQPRVSLDNGRLTVASADGDFSLSLRGTVHFDAVYFAEGRNPPGIDLNSGTNFRRAQLTLQGTAWRDWSYDFTYEFGGLNAPRSGYIYRAYLQYDGLKPFGFRIGAFAPPAGLEDATGSNNIVFMERASAPNIARGIAGAGGREGVNVYAQGQRYLVSLAYTGGRTSDAATFDEQQALVGRAAFLAADTERLKWVVDAHVTHVFKIADVAPGTNPPNSFSLSNGPELATDAVRTVNTGAMDARKVTEFGFESAATLDRFYAQGGWFHYGVTRLAAPDPDFSGWYGLASFSLTGETRRYDAGATAFRNLQPAHPLGTPGGFGAWEIKARYSRIDLDYLPDTGAAAGGIAGGVQTVWSAGLNWYPTSGLRFMLDYDSIHVAHGNAPATDISADAIGLRSQISF
jgi:phosphate-selective porin OprO/OprP